MTGKKLESSPVEDPSKGHGNKNIVLALQGRPSQSQYFKYEMEKCRIRLVISF